MLVRMVAGAPIVSDGLDLLPGVVKGVMDFLRKPTYELSPGRGRIFQPDHEYEK